ncbi:MAG: hypothetical protein ACUVRP_01830 [Chlorobiales bacterium]
MMNSIRNILLIATLSLGLLSCGEKLDLTKFPTIAVNDPVPVRYIPLPWSASARNSFNKPTDMIAGYDGTFYFIEEGENRIVNLDASGEIISTSQPIRKPMALAQTRNMQILVTAVDTIRLGGTLVEQAVILRLNLVDTIGGVPRRRNLSDATPEVVYRHPTPSIAQANANVRYTGIATFFDNSFLVSRTGAIRSDNPAISSNAMLLFPRGFDVNSTNPALREPGAIPLRVNGNGYGFADSVSSVTTLAVPPQSPDVNSSFDFLFTTTVPAQPFKVHRVRFVQSSAGDVFSPDESLLNQNPALGTRFLGEPDRFVRPADISVAGNFIFVVDSEQNKFYQFTSQGVEGVPPPPNAEDRRNVIVSFSKFGLDETNPDQLNNPRGVCFLRPYLYISDTNNGRILRMILTSDLD